MSENNGINNALANLEIENEGNPNLNAGGQEFANLAEDFDVHDNLEMEGILEDDQDLNRQQLYGRRGLQNNQRNCAVDLQLRGGRFANAVRPQDQHNLAAAQILPAAGAAGAMGIFQGQNNVAAAQIPGAQVAAAGIRLLQGQHNVAARAQIPGAQGAAGAMGHQQEGGNAAHARRQLQIRRERNANAQMDQGRGHQANPANGNHVGNDFNLGRRQPDQANGDQVGNDSNHGRRGVRAGRNQRRYTSMRTNPYTRDLQNVVDAFVGMVHSSTAMTRANLERERRLREENEEE